MYVATVPWSCPPSCCARAIARTARSSTVLWPISRLASREGPVPARRAAWRQEMPAGEGGFEIVARSARPCRGGSRYRRQIGLDDLLPRRGSRRHRALAFGLIIARLLDRRRSWPPRGCSIPPPPAIPWARSSTSAAYRRELYARRLAGQRAAFIEPRSPAATEEGMLVLYDVTSTYLEGAAVRWRSSATAATIAVTARTGHRSAVCLGRPPGCGRGVEGTPAIRRPCKQIETLKQRFNLKRVVWWETAADHRRPLEATLRRPGWIGHGAAGAGDPTTGCRGGPLQPSLFDTRDMAEIPVQSFPASAWWSAEPAAGRRARAQRGELRRPREDLDRSKRVQRATRARRGERQAVGAVIGSADGHLETDIKITASASPARQTIAERRARRLYVVRPAWRPSRPSARPAPTEPRPGRARLPPENRGSGTAPGVHGRAECGRRAACCWPIPGCLRQSWRRCCSTTRPACCWDTARLRWPGGRRQPPSRQQRRAAAWCCRCRSASAGRSATLTRM